VNDIVANEDRVSTSSFCLVSSTFTAYYAIAKEERIHSENDELRECPEGREIAIFLPLQATVAN
jgi:hypothetical protein